jgi:hypothetical protein
MALLTRGTGRLQSKASEGCFIRALQVGGLIICQHVQNVECALLGTFQVPSYQLDIMCTL